MGRQHTMNRPFDQDAPSLGHIRNVRRQSDDALNWLIEQHDEAPRGWEEAPETIRAHITRIWGGDPWPGPKSSPAPDATELSE